MIYRENPNFVARTTQPNPREVSYWIDLTESPQGQIIKTWVSGKWVKINPSDASGEGLDLSEVQAAIANLTANKADKSEVYTKEETTDLITASIEDVVDAAPGALDTLNELAAALNDDPNFATTITNTIAQKQDKLVSGTSIKTINGNSLLGEGNIVIQGGEGGDIDLSDYALKTEIPDVSEFITETEADGKYQVTLVSNTNIKTINGQSVLGSGNIEITTDTGGITDAPADGNTYGRKDNTWESITVPDTSNLATKQEVQAKQDTLVSGTNIKTINGETVLGEGNITIEIPEEGIDDAPQDSKLYGRQDGEWTEITAPDLSSYALKEDTTQLRQDVNNLSTSKADKNTTLSGYGITNAYTKTEVDGKLDDKANSSDVYTKSETDNAINTKVSALVNQAPETMNTLDELAAALGDDPNFATTIASQIGTKLDTSTYNSEKANFATKSEVNAKVSGTGITGIQVVSELPGSPTQNVLYIVTVS